MLTLSSASWKNKFSRLETDLIQIIDNSANPVTCLSGGKDSTFLVSVISKLGYSMPVLLFQDFWTPYQFKFIERLIMEQKLQAFFYRPSKLRNIGRSIIADYTLGSNTIPVIFDHIEDTSRCGMDIGRKALQGVVPYFIWDKVLVGTKRSDKHDLNNLDFSKFENLEMPLWDWSDEEVIDATRQLGFPYDERVYDNKDENADTGNFFACLRCNSTQEVFCPKANAVIQGVL